MTQRKRTRKPKQQRALATVEAIVEASARILVEDGYDALTTNRIAKVAGVSVGTLYQYFDDKEAVVHQLVDQQVERMQSAFSEALQKLIVRGPPDSVHDAVQGVLDATLEAMRVRPALFTRLIREAPRDRREDIDRRWRQRYTELLSTALRARHLELRRGDVSLMSHILVTGVYAVILDAAAYRPELMATDALRDELTHLVVAYLAPT
jgi:AcrR family transcriptional regulator